MSGYVLLGLGAFLLPLGAVVYTNGYPALGGLMLGAAVFALGIGAYRKSADNKEEDT